MVISVSIFLISGVNVKNIKLYCSHALVVCSSIKYDYWTFISYVYNVETVLKVYSETFKPIPNKKDIGPNMKVLVCVTILKCG